MENDIKFLESKSNSKYNKFNKYNKNDRCVN